jgi:hypothetical protein
MRVFSATHERSRLLTGRNTRLDIPRRQRRELLDRIGETVGKTVLPFLLIEQLSSSLLDR